MKKEFRYSAVFVLILMFLPALYAQKSSYNKLYKPLSLIQRLSYENFRSIKLLQAAIVNYGGGETEMDRLVDQYAEASALYFQNRIEDSALKFQENEKAILAMAKKLAQVYRRDTENIMMENIKLNIKYTMKLALKGDKVNPSADKLLDNGRSGYQRANDYYDRYINATSASPRELITAIYYYRRSKENFILMYDAIDLEKDKKEELKEKYRKDIDDSKNRIYRAREKQN